MKLAQAPLQIGQALARRLDHELSLAVPLDRAFPSIDRHHRPVDVHTRCQLLDDERSRNGLGAIVVWKCREDKDEV